MNPYPEQEPFIDGIGRIVLNACPGSGKTTAIAFKLNKLVHSWQPSYAGILVLSFTNAAVDELLSKYREISGVGLRYPHAIQTIDNFTNKFITLPFGQRVIGSPKVLSIAEDDSVINRGGYGWRKNYKTKKGRCFYDNCKPASISYAINGSHIYKTEYNIGATDAAGFASYRNAVKSWQIRQGILSTRDSAYWALKLFEAYPELPRALVRRFPHLIIDEAQDTSDIQDALIEKLIEAGLTDIDLVGDPNQSIYRWRGAAPELFKQKFSNPAWVPMAFKENRRSTQFIIDSYSHIRPSSEPQVVSTSTLTPSAIKIVSYASGDETRVLDYFHSLRTDADIAGFSVVARSHDELQAINGHALRCEPWKNESTADLLSAINAFEKNDFQTAIKKARRFLIAVKLETNDGSLLQAANAELGNDSELNARLFDFIASLPARSLLLPEWTVQVESHVQNTFQQPKFSMSLKAARRGANSKYTPDHSITPMQALALIDSDSTTRATTIHDVKGRTFDGLLLFANEQSIAQLLNSEAERHDSEYFPNEEQSLLYVAMSRPRRVLTIAFGCPLDEAQVTRAFPSAIELIDLRSPC